MLPADEQLRVIESGIAELVPRPDMKRKLAKGTPLRSNSASTRPPPICTSAMRSRCASCDSSRISVTRRTDHRRLHRAHRRPFGAQLDPSAAHGRADR